MKSYDDIINRFDDIPNLPVSEEMLGAYLDGNLEGDELRDVGYMVQEDSLMNYIANEVSTDSSMEIEVPDIDLESIPNLPEIVDFVPFDNSFELQDEIIEDIPVRTEVFGNPSDEGESFEDDNNLLETQFDDSNEDLEFEDDSLDETDLNDMEL